jgi:hypothetical protein
MLLLGTEQGDQEGKKRKEERKKTRMRMRLCQMEGLIPILMFFNACMDSW